MISFSYQSTNKILFIQFFGVWSLEFASSSSLFVNILHSFCFGLYGQAYLGVGQGIGKGASVVLVTDNTILLSDSNMIMLSILFGVWSLESASSSSLFAIILRSFSFVLDGQAYLGVGQAIVKGASVVRVTGDTILLSKFKQHYLYPFFGVWSLLQAPLCL